MDVGDWLRSLGLGQYEDAFRENEIDGEILPTLTSEDLKELGVAILGHRRKMLDRDRGASRLVRGRRQTDRATAGRFDDADRGRRGAPATHGDVLRSGRLDRAVGAARSRGHARSHPQLPGRLFGRGGALRRVRREIHGRRRSRLFRLSARPRRGRRTGGPGGAGNRGGRREARNSRPSGAEGPHRHSDRHRRRRRSRRNGIGAGTGRDRRHAQSGGAFAGPGRAGERARRRGHSSASGPGVRTEGPRTPDPEGVRRARSRLGGREARPRTSAGSRRRDRMA